MAVVIGIDIGGTFTDVVGINLDTNKVYTVKVPTTNEDQSKGFLHGIQEMIKKMNCQTSDIVKIIHGTTVGTNAILEEKGAKIGILTTKGFEDILEIGRQKRTDMYNLFFERETPSFLCPRKRRKGISERIDPTSGKVLLPIDEKEVITAVQELVEEHQVEAIAVNYLFSFVNPEHEIRTEQLIKEKYPQISISLSHQIDPQFREYERICLTAFDAYIKPVINKYMDNIQNQLANKNIDAPLYIMLSQGGLIGTKPLEKKAVGTLLSGVAAGVLGGKEAARQSDEHNIITLDVGGTSADVSLIIEGKSLIATESQIRSYPLRIPMVDVNTIGAGGGSIAYIDEGNNLHVGPESASAVPGPACYGRGGEMPTVTDASLVLGYLREKGLAGGRLPLNLSLAEKSIEEKISKPLGMSVTDAAMGIHKIMNAVMADAIRLVSVKRGFDPREFSLVPFGGAGGLHACSVADFLGIREIIIPATPGVLSANGLIMSDIETEESSSYKYNINDVNMEDLEAAVYQLKQKCYENMREYNVDSSGIKRELTLMMRYIGQSYELPISLALEDNTKLQIQKIIQDFHDHHEKVYGHRDSQNQIELVSIRINYRYPIMELKVREKLYTSYTNQNEKVVEYSQVYFDEYKQYVQTPIYQKANLPMGKKLIGPIIVEQSDTTTVVNPGWTLRLTEKGNMELTKEDLNNNDSSLEVQETIEAQY